MKIFRLPEKCAALIFDIDATLYTNPEYAQLQIDVLIEELARRRKVDYQAMRGEIARFREIWAKEHDGQAISLGNILLTYGISINESILWRKKLIHPEQHLAEDKQLRAALEQLEARFVLATVTNNPVSIAEKSLRALGVEDLFQAIIGLDTCGVSKPHEEPFMRAAMLCGAEPERCVAIGDRYDIDIALPLELGMGGILVDGAEDVYQLPEIFNN